MCFICIVFLTALLKHLINKKSQIILGKEFFFDEVYKENI